MNQNPNQPVSFIEELKRRNVVRVGVVYLITAWLLAQVADLMLENFNAPDWVIQAILVVLIIGFPLALIFAWAFELTPEGLKKERDVDRSQSITRHTGRKLDRAIIAILVMALGYFVWESRFAGPGEEVVTEDPAGTGAAQAETELAESAKSVAVLPFVNMSSDPEQEFFSDGISEEILNALAKVKELKVAGRTSSFAFKGQNQDLRQIGDALGVEHILEGSVRKSGTKVRITAQLIQVDDGFHLWSETYDRELDDVFAIQDEIASAILEQLKQALIGFEPETAVMASSRTDSEVYDLYLLARQRIYERKRLSIEAAVELLDKALTIDPDYAPAYAQRGIAALLLSDRNYGDRSLAEAGVEGRLYLDKALQLDPELAEGWAGIGLYYSNLPGASEKGIEPLQKALEINPNLIDASNWLQVIYSESGETQQALALLEDMVERDPLYPPGFGNAVSTYNFFGMQEKSWQLLDRIRPFLPGDPQLLQSEASTWLSLGKPSKAQALLELALESQPSDAVMKNLLAFCLFQTAQYEKLTEIDVPWASSIGLSQLGRKEEAMMIAQDLAGEGRIGRLVGEYYSNGQYSEMVEFIESRWPDLAAIEAEYPDRGDGYDLMLDIANAYSAMGNEAKFNDAMARVRAAHDHSNEQGVRSEWLAVDEARYYVLAGDRETALEMLAAANEIGLVIGEKLDRIWSEFAVLSGDPVYEGIQLEIFERVNTERAELGLDPVSA
jgi:TolB-like protein